MRLLAAVVLVLSVSCGSDAPTAPEAPTVVGTWSLRTIGGASLPYVLDQLGEDKLELLEAAFTATSGGTFSATSTQRMTISGQTSAESYVDDGSFVMSGAVVTLTFKIDNAVVTGTVRGDSLTFADSGIPVVYRRK